MSFTPGKTADGYSGQGGRPGPGRQQPGTGSRNPGVSRRNPRKGALSRDLGKRRVALTTAKEAGVYQLRPRSSKSETAWARSWGRRLEKGQSAGRRVQVGALNLEVTALAELAFPGSPPLAASAGCGRPSFPSAPMSPIPLEAKAAERIWWHTERVLHELPPHAWRGCHQTLKVY